MIEIKDIYNKTNNGLSVYKRYIHSDVKINKAFKSPLREDRNPSFSIFKDKNSSVYLFKDFAREQHTGDAIKFTMLKFNLDFKNAINKIASDFGIYNTTVFTENNIIKEPEIKDRNLNENEQLYFNQYGISSIILNKYNVKALEYYKTSKYTLQSSIEQPVFYYKFDWGGKIYNPKNANFRFMYVGAKPSLYIFGYNQLKDTDDLLIITGGEKDVMTFASLNYNAISFNSETSNIDEKIIQRLRKRFKYIAVCFDTDITGRSASKELCEANELVNINLPLSGKKDDKDISDFIKNNHTQKELSEIINKSIDKKFINTLRILRKHTFNEDAKIEKPIPVLNIKENNVLSLGNFMVLAGKVKTGKSSVLYSIISGAIRQEGSQIDTLGINIEANPNKKAVIHFDTEQSNYDWHTRILQSFKRANINKRPYFFNSYHLLEFPIYERLQHIKDMIDYNFRKHNGIHLIVIDGVADLVKSVNDEEKSNEVVDLFHQLAGIYNCPIILVVHLNPDGNKTRGHLGSQLDRKAESVLIIEREGDICSINPKYCRNANAVDIPIMQFRWDDELKQHISIGAQLIENKREKQIEEYKDVLDEIFTNGISNLDKISFKKLVSEKLNIKRSATYNVVNFMLQENLISEEDFGNKSKIINKIE